MELPFHIELTTWNPAQAIPRQINGSDYTPHTSARDPTCCNQDLVQTNEQRAEWPHDPAIPLLSIHTEETRFPLQGANGGRHDIGLNHNDQSSLRSLRYTRGWKSKPYLWTDKIKFEIHINFTVMKYYSLKFISLIYFLFLLKNIYLCIYLTHRPTTELIYSMLSGASPPPCSIFAWP